MPTPTFVDDREWLQMPHINSMEYFKSFLPLRWVSIEDIPEKERFQLRRLVHGIAKNAEILKRSQTLPLSQAVAIWGQNPFLSYLGCKHELSCHYVDLQKPFNQETCLDFHFNALNATDHWDLAVSRNLLQHLGHIELQRFIFELKATWVIEYEECKRFAKKKLYLKVASKRKKDLEAAGEENLNSENWPYISSFQVKKALEEAGLIPGQVCEKVYKYYQKASTSVPGYKLSAVEPFNIFWSLLMNLQEFKDGESTEHEIILREREGVIVKDIFGVIGPIYETGLMDQNGFPDLASLYIKNALDVWPLLPISLFWIFQQMSKCIILAYVKNGTSKIEIGMPRELPDKTLRLLLNTKIVGLMAYEHACEHLAADLEKPFLEIDPFGYEVTIPNFRYFDLHGLANKMEDDKCLQEWRLRTLKEAKKVVGTCKSEIKNWQTQIRV